MFEKLKKLFSPVTIYKIVEVKGPRTPYRWDQNTKDAVSTLSAHPGFVALSDKLNLIREQLKTKCHSERHADLQAVQFLQAGIFWSGWLQEEMTKATTRGSQQKYVDPLAEELEAFKAIDATIERVGMEQV